MQTLFLDLVITYLKHPAGPIPPELGALSALTKLDLSCNSLNGEFVSSEQSDSCVVGDIDDAVSGCLIGSFAS